MLALRKTTPQRRRSRYVLVARWGITHMSTVLSQISELTPSAPRNALKLKATSVHHYHSQPIRFSYQLLCLKNCRGPPSCLHAVCSRVSSTSVSICLRINCSQSLPINFSWYLNYVSQEKKKGRKKKKNMRHISRQRLLHGAASPQL